LRTRRNQLNLANAVSAADKEAVTQTLTTGFTTEQMQGKPRPKVDPVSGAVGTQVKKPTVPGVVLGKPPQVQTSATKLSGLLKSGSKGEQVKTWQTFLGITPPTGIFDKLTDTKTRAWQKSQGLTVDGVVGPNTWGKAFPVISTTPFAPTSASTAAINDAFISTRNVLSNNPVAAASSTTPGTPAAAKAEAAAKTVAAAQAAQAAPAVKTAEAGMLGSIQKMPTWQKVLAGLGILGLVGGTVISHHGGIPKKHAHR